MRSELPSRQRRSRPVWSSFLQAVASVIAPGLAMATVTPEFAAYPTLPFSVSGYAVPMLVDIDGDGDLDAFVGDEFGDVTYFERSGDSSTLTFAAGAINAFGSVNVGIFAAPAFADIDGDGDQDLFVGNAFGSIRFFENTGTSSSPSFSSPLLDPFGLTPVGDFAAPVFADLDGDGDYDALVGEQNGNLRYFENIGTLSSPAFGPAQTNPFGFSPVGIYSKAALVDLDGDGDLDLLVSADWLGNCVYFQNVGTPASPSFAPGIASPYGLEAIDTNSAPAFGDLDGELAGGLVVDRAGNDCEGSPCWRSSGGDPPNGNGFRYRDRAASASGVGTIKVRSGTPGRSKIVLNAANNASKQQAALPIGIASALAGNASATMQYRVSHVGCMSVELTNVKKSDADVFSARE